MAVLKMNVTYTDGRAIEVIVSPRAQVETERHFKGIEQAQTQRLESHYYLAWASLHRAGKEAAQFEEFLDLVADVEELNPTEEDEQATDPTPMAPSPTGSSD